MAQETTLHPAGSLKVEPDTPVTNLLDLSNLSLEYLDALATKINRPEGKAKPLIEYEFYCKSCKLYWSECSFEPKVPKCKNGHLTVRLLSQSIISPDSNEDNSFDNIHGLLYTKDGEF